MTADRLACGLAMVLLLCGCGGQERDRDDELGLEESSGRREVVPVDADRGAAAPAAGLDTVAPPSGPVAAAAPTSAPADTGAGPDSLVAFDPEGEFTVQLGLYQDARTAARVVRELAAEGYPAYAIAQEGGPGVRVRIGYFRTRADAQRFGEIFRRDKHQPYWIDRRAGERF